MTDLERTIEALLFLSPEPVSVAELKTVIRRCRRRAPVSVGAREALAHR